MAHFAQIDDNNTVTQVIAVSNDECGGGNFPESEPIGQLFIERIGLNGTWLQTSYHANFRGKYAAIGDVWDGSTFTTPIIEEEQ